MIVISPTAWKSVPLRSNDRMHHMAKARAVKGVRSTIAWELRAMRAAGQLPTEPIDYPVTATLIWEVTDNRVRDVGASAPTLKAALDQCVADRVLSRDDRTVVVEERYRIEVGGSKGVRIELSAAAVQGCPIAGRADSRQDVLRGRSGADTDPLGRQAQNRAHDQITEEKTE